MVRALIWIGLPISVLAQIGELATPNDGSVVYFSSSFRQKGTDQSSFSKIFRYSTSGLEFFREAFRPCVSGDGSIIGYSLMRDCIGGGMHCGIDSVFEYYDGWLARSDGPDQRIGPVMFELSEDGRYALTLERQGPNTFTYSCDVSGPCGGGALALHWVGNGRHDIANGGVALVGYFDSVEIRSGVGGPLVKLPLVAYPNSVAINANASNVVYEIAKPTPGLEFASELRSYDLLTGRDLIIATSEAGSFHPSLTNDGTLTAYSRDSAFEVAHTNGSGVLLHSEIGEYIVDAVISGWGNVAYIATTSARLIRIDIPTAKQTELIPATPVAVVTGGSYSPGGRLDVAARREPSLTFGALAAPIVAQSAGRYTFQIPWDVPGGSTGLLMVKDDSTPFDASTTITAFPGTATFYSANGYAIAAHEDFGSLVTPSNPARPNEIIHFYMTGLGPVVPPIATGTVTPIGPIYSVQPPPACQISGPTGVVRDPTRVAFAGLAPTLTGIEQVDLIVPRVVSTDGVPYDKPQDVYVACGIANTTISVAP